MAPPRGEHRVHIYYEDTDHSGLVYHANYLKYFERAREHLLGREELRRLYEEDGVGFVVYRVEMRFKEGARFGDDLLVRTAGFAESPYRVRFEQKVYRASDEVLLVDGEVEMVCLDASQTLVRLPASVLGLTEAPA
jgi:acyl-CoA thioester hydrolase